MSVEFKLPQLGDNIDTIQVTNVLVAVGDELTIDAPVLELETDKATIEVPSSVAGKITAISVSPGDEMKVGDPILSVDAAADSAAPPPRTGDTRAAPAASNDTPPPPPPPPPTAPTKPDERLAAPEAVILSEGSKVPASPSVRRFAREIGISINQVPGTGPSGRVSRDDVKAFAKSLNENRPQSGGAIGGIPAPAPLPDFSQWGPVEKEKMSVIRKVTAERMAQSWATVPHVTIYDKVDITDLENLRLKFADRAEKIGGKLSMAVMVCKVAAHALRRYPKFNASIDLQSKEIILKDYINLGIAVNTPRGLMVPVVRDADKKNMVELSLEILQLAQKVRTGKIEVSEMEGGTFTVSNLGRIAGTYFTPIVNYPEVAIIGIGRAKMEPTVVGDKIEARMILPLSLSFDHRIIDGADGSLFLRWIVDAIKDPIVLALEG